MDQETNKPQEQSTFPTAQATQKSPLAMIVGVIGFVVVLLLVGWFAMSMPKQSEIATAVPESTNPQPATTNSVEMGTSTDTAAG